MSRLLNISATGNIGPIGARIGSITLAAGGANATAVFSDSGANPTTILQLSALANSTVTHTFADTQNGVAMQNVFSVVLTGAGASVNVEII